MSLKTIAGKLLLTAAKKLAAACQCCIRDRFCCVPYGTPDECGNQDTSCQPCSGGAYDEPTCSDECPERPPCSAQCVQVGADACGQPIYECQYTTEDAGIACSEAAPCPAPPPCPDKYYCCYASPPSGGSNSPLPAKSCQVGPCSSPELNAGGPYDTQQQCEAACDTTGACCLPNNTCVGNLTESECEECLLRCDYSWQIPSGEHPGGDWDCVPTGGGGIICYNTMLVASCDECVTEDFGNGNVKSASCGFEQVGRCGTFHAGKTCVEDPCDLFCRERNFTRCGWVWDAPSNQWFFDGAFSCPRRNSPPSFGIPAACVCSKDDPPPPYAGGARPKTEEEKQSGAEVYDTLLITDWGLVYIVHRCVPRNPLP